MNQGKLAGAITQYIVGGGVSACLNSKPSKLMFCVSITKTDLGHRFTSMEHSGQRLTLLRLISPFTGQKVERVSYLTGSIYCKNLKLINGLF